MIPRRIQGATHTMGAPKSWNPDTDGPCVSLAVRVVKDDAMTSGGYCETAWEPTPEELLALRAGGSVILRVASAQVPVMLYVEPIG